MSQTRSCLLKVGVLVQNTKQNHSYYSFSSRPWLCRSMPCSKMLTGSLSSALQPFPSTDWNLWELLRSSWAADIGGLSSWALSSWSVDLPQWLWNRIWPRPRFDWGLCGCHLIQDIPFHSRANIATQFWNRSMLYPISSGRCKFGLWQCMLPDMKDTFESLSRELWWRSNSHWLFYMQ